MTRLLPFLAILALCGCNTAQRDASRILAAQTPGSSSGAGATFVGPANSAAPSTQTAERRVSYYQPKNDIPLPVYGHASAKTSAETSAQPAPEAAPAPAWIDEKVTTTYGQHQDAAAVVKLATAAGAWGQARWLGIALILCAIGGLLYSHNNPEGYPVICWKIGAIGLFLTAYDPSPWFGLLLIIPGIFYVGQKLGVIRPLPL